MSSTVTANVLFFTVFLYTLSSEVCSQNCGVSQGIDWFQEHLTDDEDVIEATWPWMAAIKGRNSSGLPYFWCSGLLIDKIHVLTVANCFVYGTDDNRYIVHIGSDDLDSAKEYPVSKIKVHEGYKKAFYDNIAILTLAREVDIPNFGPICLPDERIEAKDLTGWGTTLVGWGTDESFEPTSNVLKQLDNIPIVSNQECNQIFKETFPPYRKQFPRGISREILCSGKSEGSRDACSVDSGAALMILDRNRWFVVGLTSFGHDCKRHYIPAGYTNVSTYVDWIRQNTQN